MLFSLLNQTWFWKRRQWPANEGFLNICLTSEDGYDLDRNIKHESCHSPSVVCTAYEPDFGVSGSFDTLKARGDSFAMILNRGLVLLALDSEADCLAPQLSLGVLCSRQLLCLFFVWGSTSPLHTVWFYKQEARHPEWAHKPILRVRESLWWPPLQQDRTISTLLLFSMRSVAWFAFDCSGLTSICTIRFSKHF